MKKYGNRILDDFLLEKQVNEGLSFKSLESYCSLFNFLIKDEIIKITDFPTYTTANFRSFLGNLFLDRKWSSSTYNTYRKNLKVFCKYLVREGYLEKNPIDEITKRKEEKKLPKTLTKQQVQELLAVINTIYDKGDKYINVRNQTMFHLLLYTGIRKSELMNLKIGDINVDEGYLKIRRGKGAKDRMVPLLGHLKLKINKYLRNRLKLKICENQNYLFCSRRGYQLSNRDMRKIIENMRYYLTFHLTWHMLRHTFATELVRNNFDIYNISQLLGHSKIETTKIYLSVDTHKIAQQMSRIQMFA
ncbi:MAG: tyrosine-type recombinase/integrase [Candidatus Gracilibacteria bacterium]|nr:tyrosine-type recombinase/integrase [Candidatus Gracilibacteria bacterium]